MSPTKALRYAIMAEFGLGIIGGLLEFALQSSLPEPLRDYMAARVESISLQDRVLTFVAMPVVGVRLISWIALWQLWPSARWLYVSSWIAGLLFVAVSGALVTSALGAVFLYLPSLAGGVILGLLYFTELRNIFDRSSTV